MEGLDLTAPPSPLGSTSSLSAPEWASDGYGSSKYLSTEPDSCRTVVCKDQVIVYLEAAA